MPNHCEQTLIITGPDDVLKEIYCSHFQASDEEENGCFDCQSVIPMPVSLRITSGGHVKQFADLWKKEPGIAKNFLDGRYNIEEVQLHVLLAGYPEIIQYISFCNGDEEKLAESLQEGKKYNENAERYGYTDWYQWCVNEWDTKWGAYEGSAALYAGNIAANFQSAWSPPTKVIEELSRLYPEVRIKHTYLDEGYGFGGFDEYQDGQVFDTYEADDIALFAQEEFGHEPLEEEEEDE